MLESSTKPTTTLPTTTNHNKQPTKQPTKISQTTNIKQNHYFYVFVFLKLFPPFPSPLPKPSLYKSSKSSVTCFRCFSSRPKAVRRAQTTTWRRSRKGNRVKSRATEFVFLGGLVSWYVLFWGGPWFFFVCFAVLVWVFIGGFVWQAFQRSWGRIFWVSSWHFGGFVGFWVQGLGFGFFRVVFVRAEKSDSSRTG